MADKGPAAVSKDSPKPPKRDPNLRRVHIDVTKLNWHGLVVDELTNGQAGRAHWSLVDAYVSVVT